MTHTVCNVGSIAQNNSNKKERTVNEMAVSKQFFAELIAEMEADKIARAENLKQVIAERDALVASGHCSECLMWYCECY